MSDQLNIQFGVDATRAIRAAEQAGALAGKLFGRKFNESIESEIKTEEIQLSVNFEGAEQVEKASKAANLYKKRAEELNKALEEQRKKLDAIDLAQRKAANSRKQFAKNLGTDRLKANTQQLQKSINKLKALQRQATKGSEAYNRMGGAIKSMSGRLHSLQGGNAIVNTLGQAVQGLTAKFTLANVAAQLITDSIKMLFQAMVTLFDNFTERTKKVEALTLAMQNAGVMSRDLQAVMGSIKATALTFGTSIEDVGAAWKRLAPTVLAAGGSLKDTEQIIVAMSARTVSLGLNAEQTGRYMEALAQVMGKGKLQGEELTKQLSQLDGALRSQIEQDLKRVNPEFTNLQDAMKNGAVTADMFAESLIRVSENAVESMTGNMFSMQESIRAAGQEGGLTLQQIENRIDTLNTISLDNFGAAFDSVGKLFLRVEAAVAQFFSSISSNSPALMQFLKNTTDGLALVVEVFVNWNAILLRSVVYLWEFIAKLSQMPQQLLSMIPGMEQVMQGAGNIGQEMLDMHRRAFDAFMGIGEEAQKSVKFLDENGEEVKVLAQNYEELAEKTKGMFEEEAKELQKIMDVVKERYEEEMALIQDRIDQLKDDKETEKELYKQAKQSVIDRYEEEKREIDEVRDKLLQKFEEEKGIINEESDAEKKLAKIRKDELIVKAKNVELSEKERLQAQATLDQIARRERLEQLNKKHKQDMDALDERAEANQERKNEGLREEKDFYEDIVRGIDERIEKEEESVRAIEETVKQLSREVADAKQLENDWIGVNRAAAEEALYSQISLVNELATAYSQAAAEAAKVNAGGGDGRATGGPVSGGSTYTVNELGKEAFLSASGKLSMINAPAFGSWRAPATGTVIPAHLTKQLDIPNGGVNLNRSTKGSESAARNSVNMGRVISAFAGMSGGDNISNNVTVQSVNPGKTASDMLVSMTKIRRRRLR